MVKNIINFAINYIIKKSINIKKFSFFNYKTYRNAFCRSTECVNFQTTIYSQTYILIFIENGTRFISLTVNIPRKC